MQMKIPIILVSACDAPFGEYWLRSCRMLALGPQPGPNLMYLGAKFLCCFVPWSPRSKSLAEKEFFSSVIIFFILESGAVENQLNSGRICFLVYLASMHTS